MRGRVFWKRGSRKKLMDFETKQESFWAGEFGDQYSRRNVGEKLLGSYIRLFSRVLNRTRDIQNTLEFGSNVGLNLIAIHRLLPDVQLSAIEINPTAVKELEKLGFLREIFHLTIFDFKPTKAYDLCLSCGVAIHIHPEKLSSYYKLLYDSSRKYILFSEYYNPTPVSVIYRGHNDVLFKRDFCGEIMDAYPDLTLVDYGFVYRRDANFPLDDTNWFLLAK
jgi:pseudaminic acid biosynthesis-associated methylase